MAHFALLDENNVVVTVIVISNDDILDQDGNESEALGATVCEAIAGAGRWVQTSYNGNFRGRHAGVGFTYDADNDVFIAPKPEEFPSWVLNANFDWEPPIAQPSEDGPWRWNEEAQTWDLIPTEEPTP
jgi:hypothetical protein